MFSEEKASQAINFIKSLKHTKGKWHGVNFTLLEWQQKILEDVFGTINEFNGFRQYSTAYIEIPKKNGKSELAAAVALKMLCADGEHGAEVYGCAADRAQASIVFDVAVDMVDQNRTLKKYIKPVLSTKRLIYKPTRSYYQVLSAEAFTKHGLNPHGVIFDELHAQPDRRLYEVMTQGSGDARTQPLFFFITTAGDDPDRVSICWEVREYARRVIEGKVNDPSFYGVIYGIADDADPWNEENWYQANPSLGHTIDIEKVRLAAIKAKENQATERAFRQLRLNQWVNFKNSGWISLDVWDKSAGVVDIEKLRGRACFGGLDLSTKIDLSAFVLVFPPDETEPDWKVLPYMWLPIGGLKERVLRDKVPYDEWIRAGLINGTAGDVIDYDVIQEKILTLNKMFKIVEIGFDSWNAHQMGNILAGEGIEMVDMRQGMKTLSPATKETGKLIVQKTLHHGGHEVLRNQFGNVEVKTDENANIRPVKLKGVKRIDAVVAMIMAVGRAILHIDNKSVYEDRGFIEL